MDSRDFFPPRTHWPTRSTRMIAPMKENESLQSAAAEGAARGKRKLRILVADDERDQVTTLAAILQDEGNVVSEVYRGTEVLSIVRTFDPGVALFQLR